MALDKTASPIDGYRYIMERKFGRRMFGLSVLDVPNEVIGKLDVWYLSLILRSVLLELSCRKISGLVKFNKV